jgi:hypothetical protein
MTSQDHNKVIGIMHLIWGGFNALTMLIIVPVFFALGDIIRNDPNTPPEMKNFFIIFGIIFAAIAVLLGIPPLIAGYGMLKRKSWARVAGIVSACLTAMSFPFGTALCVYTMWFMFTDGERFYRGADDSQTWRGSLPNSNSFDWEAQKAAGSNRSREYAPPQQPPDWRGQ